MTQDYEPTYNFTTDTEELLENDLKRPNFRITACCFTCRFFFYRSTMFRIGWCTVPDIQLKRKYSKAVDADTKFKPPLQKTSAWCSCDYHRFKHKSFIFGPTSRWTEMLSDKDGHLYEEEAY